MDEHDTFPQRVWQIVASIPEGCVTTYGEVAGWRVLRARRVRLEAC